MDIISRKEALDKGLKFYFTGKPCKYGHVSLRRVSNYECVKCSNIRITSQKRKEYIKKYNESYVNKIKNRIRLQRYYSKHDYADILEYKRQYSNSYVKYDKYFDKLTSLESPRSDDGVLEVKCAFCRVYFKPFQMHVNKRVQCLRGNCSGESRLYCSEKCKDSCNVYNRNSNSRSLQKSWVSMLRDRSVSKYGFIKCEICGADEKDLSYKLIGHHISPVSDDPILSADIDNGILLCKDCHKKVHSKHGCRMGDLKC